MTSEVKFPTWSEASVASILENHGVKPYKGKISSFINGLFSLNGKLSKRYKFVCIPEEGRDIMKSCNYEPLKEPGTEQIINEIKVGHIVGTVEATTMKYGDEILGIGLYCKSEIGGQERESFHRVSGDAFLFKPPSVEDTFLEYIVEKTSKIGQKVSDLSE